MNTIKPRIVETLATNKTPLLILFAVIYGFVFINYIDIITNGGAQGGYHLWLVLMYFLPFAILSLIDIQNWKLTLGLGLLTSLMNDVFYGVMRNMMGVPYDLGKYYNLWLIPQPTQLFTLNLGFMTIPVQSWMMAASIYLRLAVVFLSLDGHKYLMANWNIPAHLSLRGLKSKMGGLKPLRHYEPEMFVVLPESATVEQGIRNLKRKITSR